MVKSTSTRTTITEAAGAPRLGLRAAVDSWRLSLRAANRSPATIKTYLDAATRFESFVAERGMPASLEGIRREHVEAFLVSLQEAGSRPATFSLAYRCLQAFWKWAVSEDEVRESPMARMTPPIVPEEPPPILRPEQIKAILDACAGTDFEARRCRSRALRPLGLPGAPEASCQGGFSPMSLWRTKAQNRRRHMGGRGGRSAA